MSEVTCTLDSWLYKTNKSPIYLLLGRGAYFCLNGCFDHLQLKYIRCNMEKQWIKSKSIWKLVPDLIFIIHVIIGKSFMHSECEFPYLIGERYLTFILYGIFCGVKCNKSGWNVILGSVRLQRLCAFPVAVDCV